MPRFKKRFLIIIIAGMAWKIVFFMGCDDPSKAPAPKPQVVSKQIPSPGPAKKKKAPVSSNDTVGKKETGASTSVTEAQVKREKAEAQTQALAQNQTKLTAATLLFQSQEDYDFKGRVDPFIPLISEKKESAPVAVAKAKIPKRVLTPLEKMELSQIKLVAILQSAKGTVAMVEEASGKGYEVRVGTYMGRNGGQVSAITPDGLRVKEFYTDYRGKRRERIEEVKFHKNEGGE